MKKLMALLCITALLCGCSSKNKGGDSSQPAASGEPSVTDDVSGDPSAATSSGEPAPTDPNLESDPSEILVTGVDTDMSNVSNVSWEKVFRSELTDFKKSDKYDDTARFTVYDINDDLIPELVISYGPYGDKTFLVWTMDNCVLTAFEPLEDCDQLSYVMDRSLINTVRYHDEIQVQNVQLYRIKSGKMANVGSFQRSSTAAKVDGEAVTDDAFDAEYNHIFSGVIKSMGLDFPFDDDVIDAALGAADDWTTGYQAILNGYLRHNKQTDDNRFSIMDVNGDDVPELFVSGGASYSPYVDVYSWNGCVVPVGTFGADGTIGYDPDENQLISIYDSPSYTAGSVYSFSKNDNFKFSELFNYGNTENSKQQDPNAEVIYKVNGELTDKSSYESAVKENVKKSFYVLGRDNDITEETVKAVGEGKYTEALKN